jgi:hypothetical protein
MVVDVALDGHKTALSTIDLPIDTPADAKHHAKLHELMRRFHNACDVSGVEYCIESGTLLGVVRGSSIIPWDDDIDLFVMDDDGSDATGTTFNQIDFKAHGLQAKRKTSGWTGFKVTAIEDNKCGYPFIDVFERARARDGHIGHTM